jgi:hypothetical protein
VFVNPAIDQLDIDSLDYNELPRNSVDPGVFVGGIVTLIVVVTDSGS